MSGRRIASVSFGKDSLAMLHLLIDREEVDEVVFYDTGAEFDAVYRERDRILPLLAERGIKYTELRPRRPFFYDMLAKPVRHRDGTISHGYGWCGGPCRWGTSAKTAALDAYAKSRSATIAVGIAADETRRIAKERAAFKCLPLADLGMTEKDCLEICKRKGHTWDQGGVCLYDVLDRVSCWCCRNKSLKELAAMREALPDYYERLCALEDVIGEPMKRRPLERGKE